MSTRIKRMCPPGQPDLRVYFSRTEMTTMPVGAERGDPTVEDPVLSLLLEIPGVTQASVRPYALTIAKAPSFDWTEVEPKLFALMRAFNLGEGRLEKKPKAKKESMNLMQPNDTSSAELGNGYKLSFQKHPNTGDVRAVVKDAQGVIVARGSVVPEAQAFRSRLEVLADPANVRWLPGLSSTVGAAPDASGVDYVDVGDEEVDEDGCEPELDDEE